MEAFWRILAGVNVRAVFLAALAGLAGEVYWLQESGRFVSDRLSDVGGLVADASRMSSEGHDATFLDARLTEVATANAPSAFGSPVIGAYVRKRAAEETARLRAEAEARRKAEEMRRKAEAEARRKAEEIRLKAEAKRKAAEARKAAETAKRKVDNARKLAADKVKAKPVSKPKKKKEVPTFSLRYRGILSRTDGKRLALIEQVKKGGGTAFYGIGDKLYGLEVVSVDADSVVLRLLDGSTREIAVGKPETFKDEREKPE